MYGKIENKKSMTIYLVVHEVRIHDKRCHSLNLLLLVLRVREGGHLQLLPGVLLLGGPRNLHALAHRIVIEVDSPRSWAISANVKTEPLG